MFKFCISKQLQNTQLLIDQLMLFYNHAKELVIPLDFLEW